jgi:hypothetical protein
MSDSERENSKEFDKAHQDAALYGSGFMVDGKHVPIESVLILKAKNDDSERERFEEWTKDYCHKHDLGYEFQTLANGEYMTTGVRARWDQWQHQAQEIQKLRELYSDLVMQVGIKHPDETRHATAKRYIMNAERQNNEPEKATN